MVRFVRLVSLVGPTVLLAGLLTLALAVVRGEASVYLVVVVPVVAGTGPLAFLAILFVFAGFFLTFLLWPARFETPAPEGLPGPVLTPPEAAPPTRRWGGVVFLGPLPLVFGSDPRMTRAMLLIGVVLFLALLALTIVALFA